MNPSDVSVRETRVSGELRAAAAARALSFYTYPPDRSQFSVRAHRAVRINAEWDAIHAKIAGDDVAYRDCRVACIVAALELPPDGSLPPGFDVESLDGACVVPAGADGSPPLVVLGTLDVNQGTKLPAEELTGVYPTPRTPSHRARAWTRTGREPTRRGTARMRNRARDATGEV